MKRTRLLFLLALLITAATGAWAKSTTHVVNQDNVNTIFSGDGYTLGDAVKDGDVLDFQGEIDLQHSLVINKQVNILSSTKDAVIMLHTVAGSLTGDAPGNSFVINKAGSGTTVQDIRIENTETWLHNTSNVTFTGVTMWVEDAPVGSGVGHVAIRYSDHVTFDGCTVYTKNNGSSSCCVLTGSHDCTFKDTRFEAVGNVGNILNLGNPFNTNDMPAGYTMNADNISVLNCTLTKDAAPSCMFTIGGLRHHIEGCTIENINVSPGYGVTVPNSANEGHTILNNTITDGTLYVPNYCTAEGNTVTSTTNVTISQGATATNNTITVIGTGRVNVMKGATVTGNTINGNVTVSTNSSDYTGSTITSNAINGTVTFAINSKNNTLTRNVITSTGDYAVVMASTADANNTVQYNTLYAETRKGDEAVNPSTGSGNTISHNSTIALMLADGTKDAANWTATVGTSTTANPLPVGGLNKKDAVTMTYNGRLKVKSVTATTDAAPAEPVTLATPLTIEAITDGTIVVNISGTLSTGMKYSVNGGTKTLITKSEDIPVAKGDKVQFYGNGTDTQVYGGTPEVIIKGSGDGFKTKVYGNIMSLLDEEGFATKTDLPADYVFFGLFRENTTLIDASELLLPAATLADACYCGMFYGCTSLTTAPKLPAETLASACYYGMFDGCTSLTNAYVKVAYTKGYSECVDMFYGCTATGAVLHTTPGSSKASWETVMGTGKTWENWTVAGDWQD